MNTGTVNGRDINRKYYLMDAEGEILGRLAARVALILSGKRKINYTPYIDDGDFVIVVNAAKVAFTGKKLKQKTYTSFSGYSGGLKIKTLEALLKRKPTEVIRHAVKGMLPKNKLGARMIDRLKVYAGPGHPHAAQKPELVGKKEG